MTQRPEINPELERSSSRGISDCDGVDESDDGFSSECDMKDMVGSWAKSASSRQAKRSISGGVVGLVTEQR